ncbi:unnamed protein product [Pleuronectes platessa]|uniref:Uncharacterized protein n=1 Tax=Pleuronectes platessa TaxID=8262 RepID=A0A9N7UY58_PLEPL|nr:unnamed protein product [Pleuronectes platessa]
MGGSTALTLSPPLNYLPAADPYISCRPWRCLPPPPSITHLRPRAPTVSPNKRTHNCDLPVPPLGVATEGVSFDCPGYAVLVGDNNTNRPSPARHQFLPSAIITERPIKRWRSRRPVAHGNMCRHTTHGARETAPITPSLIYNWVAIKPPAHQPVVTVQLIELRYISSLPPTLPPPHPS